MNISIALLKYVKKGVLFVHVTSIEIAFYGKDYRMKELLKIKQDGLQTICINRYLLHCDQVDQSD